MIGSKIASTYFEYPQIIPSGTAVKKAITKDVNSRYKLADIWVVNEYPLYPSLKSSMKVLKTLWGAGRKIGLTHFKLVLTSQRITKSAILITEMTLGSNTCCNFVWFFKMIPPYM